MAEALAGILCICLVSILSQSEGSYRPLAPVPGHQCQLLSIPSCTVLGYGTTHFPNFRNHQTQREAKKEIDGFEQLVRVNCSIYTRMLLCGYYVPVCIFNPLRREAVVIKPCRRLCETVRDGCTDTLQSFSYDWPSFFNCSLSSFSDSPICFGPPELLLATTVASMASSPAVTEAISSTNEITVTTSAKESQATSSSTRKLPAPFTTAIINQNGPTSPEGSNPNNLEQRMTIFSAFWTDPAAMETSSSQELIAVLWTTVFSVVPVFI